jgi:hypothetical protein
MEKNYKGSRAVINEEVLNFLKNLNNNIIKPVDFLQNYKQWIASVHSVVGWNKFKHLCFSNGTTEAFDKFYFRHLNRKLRLLRGEYYYHQIVAKNHYGYFEWLEDISTLSKNDVLVMSVPFADTGIVPFDLYHILDRCEELEVPVLLDLAYINLSIGLELNLDYKCIDTITSSLSKVFPVSQYRIGIRLQQKLIDDTMLAYNENQYINLHSLNIGQSLIDGYPADYSFKKYREQQITLCKELSITPSQCFIFGVDHDNLYPEYNRGSNSNRLCLSDYFSEDIS